EENLFALDVEQLITVISPFLNMDPLAVPSANTSALVIQNGVAEAVFETANPNVGVADFRFNALLMSTSVGRVTVKYTGSMLPDGRENTRLPLMKLPEMYYIAAEYYADTNPGKAIGYLNEVRSSRNIQEDLPN